MSAYSLFEVALVAVIVAACAIKAFGRFAPKTRMRLQSWLARRLDRPGQAAWLRAFGRKLGSATPDAGCGSGCDTCGTCGPGETKPVQLHVRK
ncbi:hypothetical protein CDO44_16370 [Pigmentiphaga sp. NML080357]|uniref:DUF6587 family protein n=1 Tax=Pigmentiphaga sp. NML080357 TaxID=2008675 RepID=UPI000B40D4E6|nr:DUF6587 family protein [Pigmentiphaga sp. NML080357]OVZ57950.1 hypothetical protein CDO44_16370 [Pigmentiphaga sp. NML080357]